LVCGNEATVKNICLFDLNFSLVPGPLLLWEGGQGEGGGGVGDKGGGAQGREMNQPRMHIWIKKE
jgi:hypothetical protein